MLVRVLFIFGALSIAGTAFAQNTKIDIGEGRIAARAEVGERVRVNVDFVIPAADIPDGADGFAVRRELISGARASLLGNIFGTELFQSSDASAKTITGGPRIARKLDNIPSMAMELTLSEMKQLAADPRVSRIYEDTLSRPFLNESTILIGAPVIWGTGSEGAGVAVAVLDTGSSHEHTMMNGKVVGSACFSSTTGTRSTTFCASGTNSEISATAGNNCPVDDPATAGEIEGIGGCFHGTHVASIAMGGIMNLSSGITINGVARGSNLVAVQVFSQFNDAEDCSDETPPDPSEAPCVRSFSSDQRSGLDYVLSNAAALNIASINMSLGGGPEVSDAALCDAENAMTKALIDQLRTAGVATVIASGNDGFASGVTAPGCISSAITVGSTTKADAVSGFSNSSELIDLLAPGSSIRAAYPFVGDLSYSTVASGTSMATPHVAGAFALLRQVHPGATVEDIENALIATGTPINDGRSNNIVKPRIRVDLASNLLSAGGSGLGDVALTPVTGFSVNGNLGDLSTFTTKTYTLTNNGPVPAGFTVTGDENWLAFDVSSGTIAVGASVAITVSVNTNNVTPGQMETGLIRFTVGANTTTRGAFLNVFFPVLNDDIADALPLSGITVSTSGSNVGATFESGETEHNSEFPDTGGSSIWYRWQAPLDIVTTVSTDGSNFDTVMSIYTGTTVTGLSFIAGDDDSDGPGSFSSASFAATAGTTYHIVVDGFNGEGGNISLALSPSAASNTNTLANAQVISGALGVATTYSNSATAEVSEPNHAGQSAVRSIWFDWTAPSSGNFIFSTDGSAFDTVLAVYTGQSISALIEVAANDNHGLVSTSQVSFAAIAGTSYKIAVDGVAGASGFVRLSWRSADAEQPLMVTAVLPNARSVQIGTLATGFMTVINAGAGAGTNCVLSLPSSDFAGSFTYQTTNASNQPSGSPDTPVTIPGNLGVQNFVFGVTPSQAFTEEVLTPVSLCDNGPSSGISVGVNTFTLSSSLLPPADMLTISRTLSANGVIEMASASDNGFVTIATAAIGSNATLSFSVNDGGAGLPFVSSVCETNPVTAACLAAPSNAVTFDSGSGETRTFAAFISATGDIPFAPSTHRLFITFDDEMGVSRGGSSVALRTDFAAAIEAPGIIAGLE